PDHDLAPLEINVLHPEPAAFEEAEPRAVQEERHQPLRPFHASQNRPDLVPSEDEGKARRAAGSDEIVQPVERGPEDLAIKEKKGAQRLVLRRGAHSALRGEARQEARRLGLAEFRRVAKPAEDHESPGPSDVRRFGPGTEMT